jgi:hypothetical protein
MKNNSGGNSIIYGFFGFSKSPKKSRKIPKNPKISKNPKIPNPLFPPWPRPEKK